MGTTIDPFRVLRRYWMLIAGCGLVGAALGLGAYFVLLRFFPAFKQSIYFEVRAGLRDSTELGSYDISQDDLVFRLANTETMLLTSREVLKEAVQTPQAQDTSWFKTHYVAGDGTRMIDEAVDDLEKTVKTSVVRGTNLFNVNWAAARAEDVPIILNRIADAYMSTREDLDDEVYISNKNAFMRQLSDTNRELEDLKAEMEQFIRSKGMGSLEDARYTVEAAAAEQLTGQINDANRILIVAQTTYAQVSQKLIGLVEPSPEDRLAAERDPKVASHDQAILGIKTTLRELRDKYTEADHPVIRDMENRLDAYEAERYEEIRDVIEQNLLAQQQQLDNQIETQKKLLEDLEAEQAEKNLELRDHAADQSIFEAMELRRSHLEAARENDLGLLKEVELMRLRDEANRVKVAQRPGIPRERSFPRMEIVVPFGAMLFVVVSTGLIFLRELTDQRIKGANDLLVLPGASVLGVVPDLSEDPTRVEGAELVVRKHPHSVLAESWRQVWGPLNAEMERSGYQTLLVAGCLPSGGTTTAVSNLAAAFSASGKRVAVVDANFRRPRLAAAFGIDHSGPGLGDLLAGSVTLDETLVDTDSGIKLIAAGTPASRIFERLNNSEVDRFLAEMRSRFDVIIFDSPPAVVAGEAMVLANRVDASVLVVRASHEQRGLVARVANQLSDTRAEFLGMMLNRPRRTAGGYFKKNFATMAEYAATE